LHSYSIIYLRLLGFRTDQFSLFIPAEVAVQQLNALDVKQLHIFLSEFPYYLQVFFSGFYEVQASRLVRNKLNHP
jgi:hypothetical protein